MSVVTKANVVMRGGTKTESEQTQGRDRKMATLERKFG